MEVAFICHHMNDIVLSSKCFSNFFLKHFVDIAAKRFEKGAKLINVVLSFKSFGCISARNTTIADEIIRDNKRI